MEQQRTERTELAVLDGDAVTHMPRLTSVLVDRYYEVMLRSSSRDILEGTTNVAYVLEPSYRWSIQCTNESGMYRLDLVKPVKGSTAWVLFIRGVDRIKVPYELRDKYTGLIICGRRCQTVLIDRVIDVLNGVGDLKLTW